MKKILGLDLGTTSIGWALVNEKENDNEQSSIIKLGVRVNPLSVDKNEQSNFEKGKAITTNADRTLKRSARRNLQRFKLRRENLLTLLKEHGFITDETVLCEQGNRTTFETRQLRARAVSEEITLEQLARVLLMINKKRGYKSSRKADSGEDGKLIDGMSVHLILESVQDNSDLDNFDEHAPFYRATMNLTMRAWIFRKYRRYKVDDFTMHLNALDNEKNVQQSYNLNDGSVGYGTVIGGTEGYEP